jgi:nucleotide-binding universal stress UspA family protein
MALEGFYRVVVPTDFSSCAEAAWVAAQRVARAFGAELVLVHVLVNAPRFSEGLADRSLSEVLDDARTWATAELTSRVTRATEAGCRARFLLREGVPYREILDVATDERADLLVVGTHGRGGLNRALLGSVADRVIRLAPCAVLSIREPGGE